MGIFSRRRNIGAQEFPEVIETLVAHLQSLREEYFLGSSMQLKREGADVSMLCRDITSGSELEDVLKGFQLTCVMGVVLSYISDAKDRVDFDKMLSSHLGAQEGSLAWKYWERYLNCQGHMDALSRTLATDVHHALGKPEPRQKFLLQFQGGAQVLICLSQEAACNACGDPKRGRNFRELVMRYVR